MPTWLVSCSGPRYVPYSKSVEQNKEILDLITTYPNCRIDRDHPIILSKSLRMVLVYGVLDVFMSETNIHLIMSQAASFTKKEVKHTRRDDSSMGKTWTQCCNT